MDQTYRLELHDTIEFYFQEEEWNNLLQDAISTRAKSENYGKNPLDILYEDADLLIINKDAGENVHPGDHKSDESSLIERVQDALKGKYDSLAWKPSLVHRIDRDTSGVIMIAKTKKMLEALLFLLQNGKIEKIYHTLVIGSPPKPRDTIRARLKRIENAKNEAKVQTDPNGQEAITHYKTLQEGMRSKYSLLECRIETGRTHQIRVHLASIGCPILGDKAYGNRSENAFSLREYDIHRQLLHAFSLSFEHPFTKKILTVIAPYKDDMKKIIES